MWNMSLWAMIVLVVLIGAISEMYRARLKNNNKEADKLRDEMAERMSRLEERMANVETILFEKEKADRYNNL
ncbi:hypothetical protein [Spirochaeta isovalerica]|uniref:Uncharacterized membrane-anchored protein YhcB (DUF1043 family) n=1 Tax=Spirochaeta isovalerica TaxID=150 RepID=A0A841R8K2_9SPIO|nr:hypothetical protein [Spirochaeta isovalerica]MBB6481614.1 uncharacterized membrane-anchored protein YhcB (DUF1043 family) [Spirochaeta isovalerica]